MPSCLLLVFATCQALSFSRPLRVSYVENVFRVGLPLVTARKTGGGYRSLVEVQLGTRFSVTDYHLDVETIEGGLFLRF